MFNPFSIQELRKIKMDPSCAALWPSLTTDSGWDPTASFSHINPCLLGNICGALTDPTFVNQWANQCQTNVGTVMPVQCWEAASTDPFVLQYEGYISQITSSVCPINGQNWPPAYDENGNPTVQVTWNTKQEPLRVALDNQTNYIGNCATPGYESRLYPNFNPSTDCASQLNGTNKYPGCSISAAGNGCQWHPVQDLPDCGNQLADICGFASSYCYKTVADQSYAQDCCLQTLFQRPEVGSNSVWIQKRWYMHQNQSLSYLNPDDQLYISQSSYSVNPYELYCDPSWCPSSPACDASLFLLCHWSVSTYYDNLAGGSYSKHATLVQDANNLCWTWYQSYITGGLISTHDFELLDNMILDYCFYSASQQQYPDTTSCMCIMPDGFGLGSNTNGFWGSCSKVLGNDPACAGDGERRPFVTVDSASTNVISVADYVCSNPYCTPQAYLSLITSNVLERQQACPQAVCMLMDLTRSISINQLDSTAYIFNDALTCTSGGNSITGANPQFTLVANINEWFYDTATNQLPAQDPVQTAFNILNIGETVPLSYALSFSSQVSVLGIPAPGPEWPTWLTWSTDPNTLPSVPLGPGQNRGFDVTIIPNAINGPVSFLQTVTVWPYTNDQPPAVITTPKYISTISYNVVGISTQNPKPPAPPTPASNNGVPILSFSNWSVAQTALVILGIVLILFSIYLFISAAQNQKIANRAAAYLAERY